MLADSHSAFVPRAVLRGLEQICYPFGCMHKLTEDNVREIERIHSRWMGFEVAGESSHLLTLCSDDIEFWPPDTQPVIGRTAVSAQLAQVRHGMVEETPKPCRISSGNSWVYTTFAIELETLR